MMIFSPEYRRGFGINSGDEFGSMPSPALTALQQPASDTSQVSESDCSVGVVRITGD